MITRLAEIATLLPAGTRRRVAVVKAADEHALDGVVRASREGLVEPILIDAAADVERLLAGRLESGAYRVVDVADPAEAAAEAVRLVRAGEADVIMKGHLPTGQLLKPVVDRERGIRTSALLSHVAVVECPALRRLLATTDGGMVLTPTADDLPVILAHAQAVMRTLGVAEPKAALLSAAEQVIPKLPSSVLQDAFAHAEHEGIVEGPLSLDIALSPASAREKGYAGRIQGDADIVVAPDIVACNAMTKSILLFGGGAMAGVVLGAAAPIVLVSRAASADEKYCSIALALALGTGE